MSGAKKYSEIREVTDAEATITPKSMYTYIINAEKYQKTGEIELKRVLKEDLMPEASTSYVFFRREGCHGYPINTADLSLKSPRGYVGPFQMNGAACNSFLQYMKQNYPEMAKSIKGTGTKGYLNFVKNCQDKEKLAKIIEDYALSDYFNGRVGKPEVLAENLAAHLKKTDENGKPDSTRIPLHAIAALPTGVIARGNGVQFNRAIPTLTEETLSEYCSKWISCTSKSNGHTAYQQLKGVDYITPEIITQYQTMNLSGADNLQEKYQAAVEKEELKKEQYIKNQIYQYICPSDALKLSVRPIIDFDILQTKGDKDKDKKRFDAKLEQKRAKEKIKNKKEKTPNEPEDSRSAPRNNTLSYTLLNSIRGERT